MNAPPVTRWREIRLLRYLPATVILPGVKYPPEGKTKVALVVICCGLVFVGAAFREYLITVGLVLLVIVHPQILYSRK